MRTSAQAYSKMQLAALLVVMGTLPIALLALNIQQNAFTRAYAPGELFQLPISSPVSEMAPLEITAKWYQQMHEYIPARVATRERLTMDIEGLPRNIRVVRCTSGEGYAQCLIRGMPVEKPGKYQFEVNLSGSEGYRAKHIIPFTIIR